MQSRDGDIRLCSLPVEAVSKYFGKNSAIEKDCEVLEITARLSTSGEKSTKIRLSCNDGKYCEFGYDAVTKKLFIDRTMAWSDIPSSNVQTVEIGEAEDILEILVIADRSSIEIFAAGGAYVLTDLILLPGTTRRVTFEEGTGFQPPLRLETRTLVTPS